MPPPYARGHVRAPDKDHLIQLDQRKRRSPLQHAMEAQWDSVALGWVGPVKNQKTCGSCWRFSGTGVIEIAYNMAGVGGGPDKFILSEEYGLDCSKGGGCNGDDNTTVLIQAKATGNPLSADYGPYTAGNGSPSQCHFKQAWTLYKIDDWGFADGAQGNGVTPAQSIKNTIKARGCVGCAVAAGGDSFWDSGTGIGTASSDQIDHDVILVGWDDSKGSISVAVNIAGGQSSLTCWKMRNSWDVTWGNAGYAWVREGAYSIGTEAVWAVINASAPPIDYFV